VEGRVAVERVVVPGEETGVAVKVVELVAARVVEVTVVALEVEMAVVARVVEKAEGAAEMERAVAMEVVEEAPSRVGTVVAQEKATARGATRGAEVATMSRPDPVKNEKNMCGSVGCRQIVTPRGPPRLQIRYPSQAKPR